MLNYKVVWHDDVPEEFRWCCDGGKKENCWANYRSAIIEYENNIVKRLVAWDGGEPEDQIFTRDLKWIVEELNRLGEKYVQYNYFYSYYILYFMDTKRNHYKITINEI